MKKMKHPISKNRAKKFGIDRTKQVWDKTGGKCYYCGCKLLENVHPNSPLDIIDRMYTIDHFIPLSKGGKKNDLINLVPCCRKDNNIKGNYPLEFLRMKLLFDVMGWPQFGIEQYSFLESRGIILSKLAPYKFYFEKQKESKKKERYNEDN